MIRACRIAVVCWIVGLSFPAFGMGALRTVALSGDPAPGTTDGVHFSRSFVNVLGIPVLNASGQTAFVATLGGVTVNNTNDSGIWSEGSGSLELVARTGERAPGTSSGVRFGRFIGIPALNSAGKIVFNAELVGNTVNRSNVGGIWYEADNELQLLARIGDLAPGTANNIIFRMLSHSHWTTNEKTSFVGVVAGDGVDLSNDRGIWSADADVLRLVARIGDHAPGTPNGVSYRFFSVFDTNSLGQLAFASDLTGSGVNSSNDSGIWLEDAGIISLIARAGDQAPGTVSGTHFSRLLRPVLNSSGRLAFNADLSGTDIDNFNNEGIWKENAGSFRLVARAGDQAPGILSDVDFYRFGGIMLNSEGQTAFTASLIGAGVNSTNAFGIWSEEDGPLSMVARTGDQAHGIQEGVSYSRFSHLSLNSQGQKAFYAELAGIGVDGTNDAGIWAEDQAGKLLLIAREGELLDVGPSDSRTIRELAFLANSGSDVGRRNGFNDRGQLAFRAIFTDGSSGIFVSNLVAVPEPGSLALMLVGMSLVWMRCARIRVRV